MRWHATLLISLLLALPAASAGGTTQTGTGTDCLAYLTGMQLSLTGVVTTSGGTGYEIEIDSGSFEGLVFFDAGGGWLAHSTSLTGQVPAGAATAGLCVHDSGVPSVLVEWEYTDGL